LSVFSISESLSPHHLIIKNLTPVSYRHWCVLSLEYVVCPKSNENNFLRSAEGLGKESGGRGRWRGSPGIQFDLPEFSPRLCSSQYVSKVRSSFCVLSREKMQRSLEQRYAIKVCAKLGKSGSEMLQLLRTAYGDAVMSSAQVLRWHKVFKSGGESVEDEQRAGRPSYSRTEKSGSCEGCSG